MATVSDDASLVVRTLAGDQAAYAELVSRYHGEVYHLALRSLRLREDAEDLTQEAFIRAYRALDSFDTARPFGAWIYAITARLCIDFHRRRRVRVVSLTRPEPGSADEEHEWELPDPGEGPAEEFARGETAEELSRLIDLLPHDYRIAILLRHAHDLAYEEIAKALDTPLGTIKARIHRARAQLRAWLEGTELAPTSLDETAFEESTGPETAPEEAKEGKKKGRNLHPDDPSLRKRKR
jgi:RNA polymerase sigma-70 factor (ECF subfamily)